MIKYEKWLGIRFLLIILWNAFDPWCKRVISVESIVIVKKAQN
jgi:hypothetical protein